MSTAVWADRYCSSRPVRARPAGIPMVSKVMTAATTRPRSAGGACRRISTSTSTRTDGTPSIAMNSSPAIHHGPNGTASSASIGTSRLATRIISAPGRSLCSGRTRAAPSQAADRSGTEREADLRRRHGLVAQDDDGDQAEPGAEELMAASSMVVTRRIGLAQIDLTPASIPPSLAVCLPLSLRRLAGRAGRATGPGRP